jgi:hypothetical protein
MQARAVVNTTRANDDQLTRASLTHEKQIDIANIGKVRIDVCVF